MATCRALAAPAGLDPAAVHRALFGSGLDRAFDTGRLDEAGFAAAAAGAIAALAPGLPPPTPGEVLAAWADIFTRDEAALALLGPLASRHRLALLSNTNPTHWRRVLDLAPEVGRIPLKLLSFEVGLAKPDPAIYLRALAALGLPPAAVAFVDDRPENLAPAAALGLSAVLHPPGTALAATLAGAGLG